MENKRSNQYDWFRGNNNPNGKPAKSTAKSIWKITRIFIYLALFVFTMTGCVQSFVIKTENTIGNGVEFYNSKSEISPHVTKFDISKEKVKDSTKTDVEIYKLNINNKKPVWVRDDKVRGELIAELDKQGVKSLADAFKGGNEAISIQGPAAIQPPGWNDKFSVEKLDGNPATWSTESTNAPSKIESTNSTNVKDLGIRYFRAGIGVTYKIDFNFFDPTNLSSLSTEDVTQKNSILAINTILNKSIKPETGSAPTTIFAYLDAHLLNTPISTPTTGQTYPIIDVKTLAAQEIMITILKYAGISVTPGYLADSGDSLAQLSYHNDFVPGIGYSGSTAYRPMVKWGDAWKRGPFYGIFVYPIANIASHIVEGMGDMNGWEMVLTIFIVVWATRALTFALSFKSIIQQAKMQELAGKKAVIDAKYAAYKGNKQMDMRKNQEVQELYKKEGVSMFGSIGSIFLTMPFFLAMWRVIGAIPHLKAGIWAGISFPATSWKEMFAGEFQYLPLILAAAFFAAAQQIVPRLLTKRRDNHRINVQQKAAMKKNNKTQNIMMVVFVAMAVIFNAGLQMYWVAGGIWMVGQSIATHYYFVWQSKRKRRLKVKT